MRRRDGWFRIGQTVTVAAHRDTDGTVRAILGEVLEVPDEYRVLIRAGYPLDRHGTRLKWFQADDLRRIQREHPPEYREGNDG
jgi:hypothetical protein